MRNTYSEGYSEQVYIIKTSLQTPPPRVKSSCCETCLISSSPEKMLKTWAESAAPSALKTCREQT